MVNLCLQLSIGFLLGVERLTMWFKLQVAYVAFTAVWYAILVWAAGLGAAGRGAADRFSFLVAEDDDCK